VLPAHVAIANLIYTYAEKIDLGDFDGVAELFTHAVVTAEGTQVRNIGKDQVLKMYVDSTRRYPDNGTPHTKHVTTNLILDIDEEAGQATCHSYFTVFQQTEVLALQPVIAGRYHDRFERVDGQWRFTARHMLSDLIGDLSQHLLIDISVL
jgi:ketosteroid isomerase-like protein